MWHAGYESSHADKSFGSSLKWIELRSSEKKPTKILKNSVTNKLIKIFEKIFWNFFSRFSFYWLKTDPNTLFHHTFIKIDTPLSRAPLASRRVAQSTSSLNGGRLRCTKIQPRQFVPSHVLTGLTFLGSGTSQTRRSKRQPCRQSAKINFESFTMSETYFLTTKPLILPINLTWGDIRSEFRNLALFKNFACSLQSFANFWQTSSLLFISIFTAWSLNDLLASTHELLETLWNFSFCTPRTGHISYVTYHHMWNIIFVVFGFHH